MKLITYMILTLSMILFGLGGCTAANQLESTPATAAATPIGQPSATPELAVLPHETATLASDIPITLTPPTPTPSGYPTSEALSDWLLYENAFYHYQFRYPPAAEITVQGVTGFPTEELPENMTAAAYQQQLAESYPHDICVSIRYKSGFVLFRASWAEGGKYSEPCGITGIGAYDVHNITETVTIDGLPYMVSGIQVRERDEAATWHSEFYTITLPGGIEAQYGSIPFATQNRFLETKEALLQIVGSFRSQAVPLPVSTSTPIPGLVTNAARVTPGDWSPDGRYLAFIGRTADGRQAALFVLVIT